MSDLLSVAEAQQLILRAFSKTESVKVDVPQALRKILAEDVFSSIDLPAFSNSSMDGFAVRSGDVMGASPGNPVKLRVVGDVAAGHSVDVELESGQAVRIMTGGPLPLGSDAVVPVEDTRVDKERADEPFPQSVGILKSVTPGDFI
ncbi:MAG: gephyrin-like molybdotransferase Glp, partial [Anaerolineales bacterium]